MVLIQNLHNKSLMKIMNFMHLTVSLIVKFLTDLRVDGMNLILIQEMLG